MTSREALLAAEGWLKTNADPAYIGLNFHVSGVETFSNISGEPSYYIVNLQPAGFIIVSAEDSVEPIIGFSDEGAYDAATDNPLASLVMRDITERTVAAIQTNDFQLMDVSPKESEPQSKWNRLITLGQISENGFELLAINSSLAADIRVPPLIKSKWSQTTCCPSNPLPCYNYYTPNQYSCGCVATTMAQLMRYHKYPVSIRNPNLFDIRIDGTSLVCISYWRYEQKRLV